MPTSNPHVDLESAIYQFMRDDFERLYLPPGGFEGLEGTIKRVYSEGAMRPLVRALMADVLSGRWGLGNTQQEIADALGMERSRVSDAFRKGELDLKFYLALTLHAQRPEDWEWRCIWPDAMNRAGFIAVAQLLGAYPRDRRWNDLTSFHELNYELMCKLLYQHEEWLYARMTEDSSFASRIVFDVECDTSLDVIPFWYMPEDVEAVTRFLDKLKSPSFALTYLCHLQDDLEDIYVSTAAVTECERR